MYSMCIKFELFGLQVIGSGKQRDVIIAFFVLTGDLSVNIYIVIIVIFAFISHMKVR